MANYAIGDLQGCYTPLMRLLDLIDFDEHKDRLWLVGDLVNRGPESLAVLRFLQQLIIPPQIVLGNHDLHLLHLLFSKNAKPHPNDTLQDILLAPDREVLGHWLRKQPLLIHEPELNIIMCHAGIYPLWDLNTAKHYAKEFGHILSTDNFSDYLYQLYGNEPSAWSATLNTTERLRFICNAFTRMRFCHRQGQLNLNFKGTIADAPEDCYPWYAVPGRRPIAETIIFGHWAAIQGQCSTPNIYAIDTGCVWGGQLTALRVEDKQRFSVPGV